MYFLYIIRNKLNNKLYVGISKNPHQRWKRHKSDAASLNRAKYAIHFAINKYGSENFTFEIIKNLNTLNEANQSEINTISQYKKEGQQLYNETDGGEGLLGHTWTEEQKQKASERNSGSGNPMYGVQLFGEANGNYGKEMKPHVKQNLIAIRRKLTDDQISEIISLHQTNNFTQTQLSKKFNISLTQIHRIIHGKSWGTNNHDEIITKPNITIEKVKNIRDMYASNNYTQKELSNIFKLSIQQIGRIIRRERWKNI